MPETTLIECRACGRGWPAAAMGHIQGGPTCAGCLSALVQAADARLHKMAELLATEKRATADLMMKLGKHSVTPEQRQRDMTADDIAIERARRKAKSLRGEGEL